MGDYRYFNWYNCYMMHSYVVCLLFAKGTGELQSWGYQPSQDDRSPMNALTEWGDRSIKRMFGDLELFVGAIDDQGNVWYRILESSTCSIQPLASKAQDAVYCSAYKAIYVMTGNFDAI